MGTRGLVGVKYNDKMYATYNHWDSYPDALGAEMLVLAQKINDENGWDVLKHNINGVDLVGDKSEPTQDIINKYRKYANTGVSSGQLNEWYVLMRELQGADIIREIYNGNVQHMIDNQKFLNDSLSCEYAYIINLDSMHLDCYADGNNLIASLPLDNLNVEAMFAAYKVRDDES